MPSPIASAADAARAQQVADLAASDPELVRFIASAAVGSQKTKLNLPYFSRVRFRSLLAGGEYVLEAGSKVTAFSYGLHSEMGAAGFPRQATDSDTNLINSSKTKGGETVRIDGFSVVAVPSAYSLEPPAPAAPVGPTLHVSDADYLAGILSQCHVSFSLKAGSVHHQYGPGLLIPQQIGLSGSGITSMTDAPLQSGTPTRHFATSGWPYAGNIYRLPIPYYWTPSGDVDSAIGIEIAIPQRLVWSPPVRAGAAGVQAQQPPPQVIQEFLVVLASESVEGRGVNQ